MNREDYEIIEELVRLTEADMTQKEKAVRIIQKYLDPGFSMCMTCAPQVQAAFKRIKNWWSIEGVKWRENIFTKKSSKKK